ncbi:MULTISPECIES: DapH/DapD/GlmU-related protein [unclassified Sphingomonas]|uniref:DapH/DapD/GlmU-related protein n=1 Tax=unclassified Sphingomonas TaxID=196159 RepID=UPI0006FC61DB|nr:MULTISPECIES: hypothetical protein [unclassified Sphingomonas]KQX18547.1 hypothetical protein ASD17_15460 [Sphingomonas sp. Root1294]KQY72129.1 hypothetical protein ASD39_19515 [Sphingomonas sp. Root50]KRB94598.1 hypothetical protein ASE22_01235 [Sphingomonas sp. Root720]
MSIFRIRDYLSVLLYRLFGWLFGSFGRRVRVVWPLRLTGLKNMHVGDDVTIAQAACILVVRDLVNDPRLSIGNGTKIGEFAHIVCSHDVSLGKDVLIAHRVFISDCGHAFGNVDLPILHQGLEKGASVSIGDGTWLGENVCILSATVGRNCIVGANSVVTGVIPDYSVVVGAPAKIVRRFCTSRRRWLPTDPDGRFRDGIMTAPVAAADMQVTS